MRGVGKVGLWAWDDWRGCHLRAFEGEWMMWGFSGLILGACYWGPLSVTHRYSVNASFPFFCPWTHTLVAEFFS